MNEQLQSKLVEILAGIQSATKAAGDFAMEQLPDIAQSYLLYGRISTLVSILVGVAMLCASAFAVRAATRKSADEWVQFIGGGVGAFLCIIGFMVVSLNFSDALLVWLAPKVWLLKELAHVIK